ncbi:MAG: hypothetical protein VKS61_16825 [Candidatus Sericytochromatia bacterium]|jgi:hypothetical protein|nr:hypothetical protein [Candidatus Sericytochromatia bacterium]
MIRFGHYYLDGQLIVFDLTLEDWGGRTQYVAAWSEHPEVAFRAVRPETAIERLKAHMAQHGAAAARRLAS